MSLDDQYSVIAKVLDASGNTQEFGVEAGLQGQILTCDYNFSNVFTFKDAIPGVAATAKFVYLASLPAGYANKAYANGSVVFGGLTAPFLSVKSTAGLTNSGTNGWVRTATLGAEGRFYSPTTTQWSVNIVSNYTALYNSLIKAKIYNSLDVLQSERYVAANAPNSIDALTFNVEMNAGDYLQFEASDGNGIQLQYSNELYTSLQIREL